RYTSPVKFNLLFKKDKPTPSVAVRAVSQVRWFGITAGTRASRVFIRSNTPPEGAILSTPRQEYGSMFPYPTEPYEPRILNSELASGLTSQNGSCDIRQPADTEGKNAHCSSVGNFEDPS